MDTGIDAQGSSDAIKAGRLNAGYIIKGHTHFQRLAFEGGAPARAVYEYWQARPGFGQAGFATLRNINHLQRILAASLIGLQDYPV